jgi:ribosomal protein L35
VIHSRFQLSPPFQPLKPADCPNQLIIPRHVREFPPAQRERALVTDTLQSSQSPFKFREGVEAIDAKLLSLCSNGRHIFAKKQTKQRRQQRQMTASKSMRDADYNHVTEMQSFQSGLP